MAAYAVHLLSQELGDPSGKRVIVLGLAYRGGLKEASFSSALLLIRALRSVGAVPLLNDPLFTTRELLATGAVPHRLGDPVDADAVVLQTDHAEYQDIDWRQFTGCRIVVDGRNALDPRPIQAASIRYIGVGRGEADD